MLGIGTAIPFNQNVGNLVAPLNPLQMSVPCGLWYDFTDLSQLTLNPSDNRIYEITQKGTILNADLQNRTSTAPISTFSTGHFCARFNLSNSEQLPSMSSFSLLDNGVFVIVARLSDLGTPSVYGMATMRSPNVVSMRFINNGANTTISQFTTGSTSATDSQATSPLATKINVSMYNISSTDEKLTAFNNNKAVDSENMPNDPITTAGTFIVGSSNTSAQFFNGDIFEVIYFLDDLTDQLRGEILAYTETKYAIPQA